ncbi:MAG: phosphotransferase [Caldilineaceae bacterium]|nr:phosphotransferase [Caldilineaceae bacterium]
MQTELTPDTTKLAAYALQPPITLFPLANGSNNRVAGVRSGDGKFVFKTIVAPHDLAALRHEQRLLHWLATQELPFAVPAPLPTRAGELILHDEAGYHMLMPLLPGQKPEWRDPEQMRLVGAALGTLHPVLVRYPHSTEDALPAYGALEKIHPLLPNPYALTPEQLRLPVTAETDSQLAWWRDELAALRTFINGPYRILPQQLIHSDFGHSNTLYLADAADGHITAVLDFEFAGPDVRAMDLASGLYFCMRIWENPDPLVNASAFCRGYAQRQQVSAAEILAIPWLMRLRNAASTIWWFGRALATGEAIRPQARTDDMRSLVTWLEGTEGKRFTEVLHLLTHPSENDRNML